jgi:integrase
MKVYVKPGKRGKWILVWTDDEGRERQKTTHIPSIRSKRKLAEREAALLEQELDEDNQPPQDWLQFRKMYLEHCVTTKKSSRQNIKVAFSHLERICNPVTVQQVTSLELSKFVSTLTKEGKARDTVYVYLKRVKAALNWAASCGYIAKPVRYSMRGSKRQNVIRTRAISAEELDRMTSAAKIARPTDFELWQFYIKGLYYSGLRREESIKLGWSWEFDISVNIEADIPHYVIMGEGQKSGQDQLLPIVPEFAEMLKAIPKRQRRGRVFKLPKKKMDFPDLSDIGRKVTKIAEIAKVVVNREGGFATIQTFRKTFGTRWATRVMPAELQKLMRHEDIKTTMKYYVNLETQNLWDKINQDFERVED